MDVNLVVLGLIVSAAAFAQGFSGFGYGIIVMAALSLVTPDMERAAAFVMLSVVVLLTTLLIRSRKHVRVDFRQVGLLLAGAVFGIPLGYLFVLRCGDLPIFRVVFGTALILFALNGIAKPHLKRHIPSILAPLFGLFTGVLSGAFSSGGPPTVIYLYAQEDDPRLALGSLQTVFLGLGIVRMVVVALGGRGITATLIGQSALMAPLLVLAAVSGFSVARKVSCRRFLLVVYGLITAAGLMNILKGLGA